MDAPVSEGISASFWKRFLESRLGKFVVLLQLDKYVPLALYVPLLQLLALVTVMTYLHNSPRLAERTADLVEDVFPFSSLLFQRMLDRSPDKLTSSVYSSSRIDSGYAIGIRLENPNHSKGPATSESSQR